MNINDASKPRSERRHWNVALLIQILLVPVAFSYGDGGHPIGMAFAVAPIFGLVFFVLSSAIGKILRRPFVGLDAVRVLLWTTIGFAWGVCNMTNGYHAVYWPHHASLIGHIAGAVIRFAFGLILVTTVYSVIRERKAS